MRCLIGFFGLTRSLPETAGAIRTRIYEPLRQAGITTQRAGHFNLPQTISNPRSGEHDIVPEHPDGRLLDLDLCWIEPQSHAAIAPQHAAAQAFPDPFGDRYRSIANLCHQLRSLERLWSLLQLFGTADADVILLLRPDLLYLDALDPDRDLQLLLTGRADLVVPAWQDWGGLNDRFAFCTPRAARIYATRIRLLIEACHEMRGLHPEIFLKFTAEIHGLTVARTPLRAVRVRANGRIAGNDAGMLDVDRARPHVENADTTQPAGTPA